MANSLPDYTKIPTPFANNGDRNTIPQQATNNGLASFAEGFPEITSLPLSDGGQPPTRADFNAIGYMSTNNIAYLQQGGIYTFDNTISQAIGGYPQGAILAYINNGKLNFLISKINNNTYNFNTNSSYIGQYWDYAVNLQDYLPLTGGTLTGNLMFNTNSDVSFISNTKNTNAIGINGGIYSTTGGHIRFYGSSSNTSAGAVVLGASDGTQVKTIFGVYTNGVTSNGNIKAEGDLIADGGNIIINGSGTPASDLKSTTIDATSTIAPTVATYVGAYRFRDKNNQVTGQVTNYFDTNNTLLTGLTAIRKVNGSDVAANFVVAVKGDGEITCNATKEIRSTLLRWSFPDWSRMVSKTPNTDYVAEKNGWILSSGTTSQSLMGVQINGVYVGCAAASGSSDSGAYACLVPISKGQAYKGVLPTSRASMDVLAFIPCYGEE